jgi:hypothetical protein
VDVDEDVDGDLNVAVGEEPIGHVAVHDNDIDIDNVRENDND